MTNKQAREREKKMSVINEDFVPEGCECKAGFSDHDDCGKVGFMIQRKNKRIWVCSNCVMTGDAIIIDMFSEK